MTYDGAGNIWKIGANTYYYDEVSRLVESSIDVAQTNEAQTRRIYGSSSSNASP